MPNEQRLHHYVPKSYLRKFIDPNVMLAVGSPENLAQPRSQSYETLCREKDHYRLTGDTVPERQAIENAYSAIWENGYTDTYRTLTDPSVLHIDAATHRMIIGTITSMLFRTQAMMKRQRQKDVLAFSRILAIHEARPDEPTLDLDGDAIEVAGRTAEELARAYHKKHRTERVRTMFNAGRLLEMLRGNDHIQIVKVNGPYGFLTSNNPVRLVAEAGRLVDPGNPDLALSLPIDRKHRLELYPVRLDRPALTISRLEHSGALGITEILMSNKEQCEQAAPDVIGHPDDVASYWALLNDHEAQARATAERDAFLAQLVRDYPEVARANGYPI